MLKAKYLLFKFVSINVCNGNVVDYGDNVREKLIVTLILVKDWLCEVTIV